MKILRLPFLLLTCLAASSHVFAYKLPKPIVETDWLSQYLDSVSIIDVRSSSKSFTAEPDFRKDKKTGALTLARVGGHIPGANLVLYKKVRGEQIIDGTTIKHMLPSKAAFQDLMQNAGINSDSNIIVVTNAEDAFDLTMASRMYWQIKYFGHDNVSILNGGTAQWLIDGHAIQTTLGKSNLGNWKANKERPEILASSDDVVTAISNNKIQIIDVRPMGQYLGTYKSSKVSKLGHIPTAKLYPVDLIANRNIPVKFSSIDELKTLTKALGIDSIGNSITYCNSGHMASGSWFVFHELLGNKNTKLYDGSMHQWTAENRPVVIMRLE